MFYSLLLEKVDRLNNDYSDSGSETMHNGHHEYVHEKVTSNNRKHSCSYHDDSIVLINS